MSEISQISDTYDSESQIQDFIILLKPKVMSLVVFSGVAGMMVAPGFWEMHPLLMLISIFALALGSGAAGAINMWYDRDIDAVMNRTRTRPIPAGRMVADEALSFGVVMSLISVLLMGLATNWVAGALLALANLFYVFVYTIWLKRRTPQNIVIGGAAGAFPPMIGWAAVSGDITLDSVLLFAIIFFWTPPHFWALALFCNEDYKRANVPMLPVVSGEGSTKWQMLAYTVLMIPLSMAPYFTGLASVYYAVSACLMSVMFMVLSISVLKEKEGVYVQAKRMFGYSVFYLFALFSLLIVFVNH